MKKLLFSGLISCGFLLTAAQTSGQTLFAYAENNNVVLRWSAANERFILRYIVERSSDSIHFTPLHEVVSKGPYTDDTDNAYEDADTYPTTAENYYRVQAGVKHGRSFYTPAAKGG